MGIFTIELSSRHAEWRRFKVRLMCEMQDSSGERIGFVSSEQKHDGVCVLQTGNCASVRTLVYVIPESLPAERRVYLMPEFAARLRVECDGRVICDEELPINHWGGTSIERHYDSTEKS